MVRSTMASKSGTTSGSRISCLPIPIPRWTKRPVVILSLICLIFQGITFFTSFLSIQRSVIFASSSVPSHQHVPPSKRRTAQVTLTEEEENNIRDNSWWIGMSPRTQYNYKYNNICESTKNLQSYLNHYANSTTTAGNVKFSIARPICPRSAYTPIHVIIPFYNLDMDRLRKAVHSVTHQDYPPDRLKVWVYDDGSTNDSGSSTLHNVCRGSGTSTHHDKTIILQEFTPLPTVSNTQEAMDHAHQFVTTTTTNNNQTSILAATTMSNRHDHAVQKQPQLICIRSTTRLGPAGSKFWALQLVHQTTSPNDVVMIVDGDDQLLHEHALHTINQKYLDQSAWFTYGNYRGKWSEQMIDLPKPVRRGEVAFQPRNDTWRYGHPRTFKAHLLSHLDVEDFQYEDGSWLLKGTECGMVFRLLELAGPKRIGYIATKIYQYNYNNQTSTMATLDMELQNLHKNHSKFGMIPTSEPLELPLHIVILVWKRTYLLQNQLTWLQQQQINITTTPTTPTTTTTEDGGEEGEEQQLQQQQQQRQRPIHVHLVNNNLEERNHIDELVKEWKATNLLGRTSASAEAMEVTVTHMMDQGPDLHHNFARFVYVNQLRQTHALDEVVFLDDDQYWKPDFVNALVTSHEPKGMTTWYGKTFRYKDLPAPAKQLRGSSSSNSNSPQPAPVAKYWAPDQRMEDIVFGTSWPQISHYKYGGGGGAIYDTNLWLLDTQLLRLANDLKMWSKIDDLWASYVIDALLGWEIRRLDPNYLPIDIGGYQEMEFYREAMTPKLSPEMQEYFNTTYLADENHPEIMKAATYLDPGVNKQEMFWELQTKFCWDGFTGSNGQSETIDSRRQRIEWERYQRDLQRKDQERSTSLKEDLLKRMRDRRGGGSGGTTSQTSPTKSKLSQEASLLPPRRTITATTTAAPRRFGIAQKLRAQAEATRQQSEQQQQQQQQQQQEQETLPPENVFRGKVIGSATAEQQTEEGVTTTTRKKKKASDVMKQMRQQSELFRSTWNRRKEEKLLG